MRGGKYRKLRREAIKPCVRLDCHVALLQQVESSLEIDKMLAGGLVRCVAEKQQVRLTREEEKDLARDCDR